MTKSRVFLIILVVIVLAVVVVGVVVDRKFGAIRTSPKVSHTTLVSESTRALAVVDAPNLKGFIERHFLQDTGIPPWALPLALPYEAALVVDADLGTNDLSPTIFINDKRLAPVILELLNGTPLPAPLSTWFSGAQMQREKPGVLTLKGSAKVEPGLLGQIRALWPNTDVGEPIQTEGGHLAEIILDNRDGSAVALVGAVMQTQGQNLGEIINEGRLGMIKDLAFVRIQADVTDDDTLNLRIEIECTPGAERGTVAMMGFALDFALAQAKSQATPMGISLEWQSEVVEKTVVYNITIKDWTPLLAFL
ncbi:MAG: hypothetical protein GWP08_05840 [Nitrospiraceae bacterium]|nr:hypothetical protein [Nitrospiraceae bacterium]